MKTNRSHHLNQKLMAKRNGNKRVLLIEKKKKN